MMTRFFKRRSMRAADDRGGAVTALPEVAISALELPAHSPVLAWAELAAGAGWAAATTERLHAALTGQPTVHMDWHNVEHATWNDPVLVVTFHQGEQLLRLSLDLAAPGMLPQVLRERVSATVAYDAVRTLESGAQVRFIARRPIGSGAVLWETRIDEPGINERSHFDAEIASALAELRVDLGL